MRNSSAGFTLLELVIALTIVAVILVLIQSGLRISVRAREKAESVVEKQQSYRFVLELLRTQLTSACWIETEEKKNEKPPALFKGDASSVEFFSLVSLIPGDAPGRVRVRYRVNKGDDDLLAVSFYQQKIFFPTAGEVSNEPAESEWHALLSGVKEFSFGYLASLTPENSETGELSWQPAWTPGEPGKLPLAVRIDCRPDEKSSALQMVVPVGKGKGA